MTTSELHRIARRQALEQLAAAHADELIDLTRERLTVLVHKAATTVSGPPIAARETRPAAPQPGEPTMDLLEPEVRGLAEALGDAWAALRRKRKSR